MGHPHPKPQKISQAVIAHQLNLSVGTVSKALRGLPEINPATTERVIQAAHALGYPLPTRQTLQTQREVGQRLAGVLVNSSTYRASRSGYLEGISTEAVRSGFSIVMHYVQQHDCDLGDDRGNLPWAMRQADLVDGLILVHHWPEDVVRRLSQDYRCVSIMHEYANCALDYVGVDNETGVAVLMSYLHKQGHRKIGFFGHHRDLSWSRKRFAGYTNGLCRLGLEMSADWIIEVEREYPEEQTRHWQHHYDTIARHVGNGVTAWMCASDLAGYELCQGLSAHGLRIPDDVAVTGFDSSDALAGGGFRLTSLKVRSHELGAAALRLLQTRVQNPNLAQQSLQFGSDFVRGNTA